MSRRTNIRQLRTLDCEAECSKEVVVSSLQVTQGSDSVKICCDVLGRRAIGFSKFASLACAISNTATAASFPYPWGHSLCAESSRPVFAMSNRR